MRPASVTVRAPGKVNLHLGVGALNDDGYHDVHNVLQAVSIYDELTAGAPAEPGAITMSLAGEGADTLPIDAGNLVIRAAQLIATKAGVQDGVHVAVRKSIPVMAGMAGGSADGAGALVACDAFWGTGLSRHALEALAAELGSDVPFALTGGTALGTGRGERLTPILSRGSYSWVFALDDSGLSTPAVYAELDRYRAELPRPALSSTDALLTALGQGDPVALGRALANDLQIPALRLRPKLSRVLAAGRELGALGAVVSGSGPTCAFLARDPSEAVELASALAGEGVCRTVISASGPVPGVRISQP